MVGPYTTNNGLVHVICKNGHDCWPRPSSLTIGQGLCAQCAGREWDVFYVVVSSLQRRVKFGITSGDPRARLGNHRRAGYTEVVRVLPERPGAALLERHVRATLRDADIFPLHGREYFDLEALPVVLGVVYHWTPVALPAGDDGDVT